MPQLEEPKIISGNANQTLAKAVARRMSMHRGMSVGVDKSRHQVMTGKGADLRSVGDRRWWGSCPQVRNGARFDLHPANLPLSFDFQVHVCQSIGIGLGMRHGGR